MIIHRNRKDFNLKEIVEKYSIKKEDIIKVKKYCENINIDFAASIFLKEADFLDDILNVNFLKLASMDCNNYEFIEYVSKKNKPTILSTKSHDFEIDKAVKAFEKACKTNYYALCNINYSYGRKIDKNSKF